MASKYCQAHTIRTDHDWNPETGRCRSCGDPQRKPVARRVEGYGNKGFKRIAWRKTFKSIDAMRAWAEKNDAEIIGTRECDEGEK